MTRRVTKCRLKRHAMMIAKIFGYATMTKKKLCVLFITCAYMMHTSALMGTLIGITNTKTCSCLDEFSASVYMHLKITADSLYIVFYTKVLFFFFIP